MPAFKDVLKSENIAAVATYVRNSFGNKADLVTTVEVNALKDKTKDRTGA